MATPANRRLAGPRPANARAQRKGHALDGYEAVKSFRARAARGAGKTKRGLRLLAKARGERKPRRS